MQGEVRGECGEEGAGRRRPSAESISVSERKEEATAPLTSRLRKRARLMATARSRKGNISETTTMLSGPMPMASGRVAGVCRYRTAIGRIKP